MKVPHPTSQLKEMQGLFLVAKNWKGKGCIASPSLLLWQQGKSNYT